MENTRTPYSKEEKMEMILAILSKKTTIQKIASEKGIAPTLISLWKKQAVDAMEARFSPQPKGRPKVQRTDVPTVAAEVRVSRNEARSAKIKATHLEMSLRDAREKLARAEEQLQSLATLLGYKLVKVRRHRGPRKTRQA